MGKLLTFLFGKRPAIFDQKGNIVHKLSDERWSAWSNRFEKNVDYDWRKHHGTERKISKPQ